jgi:hypothetical protein
MLFWKSFDAWKFQSVLLCYIKIQTKNINIMRK